MREILSKHDLRQLELLEFLVKNKQKWTLLKTISDYLDTPLRTIHSDIQDINSYIDPIHISSSPSGVKIVIPQNYSERYLYKKVLEESLDFNFIEYIFMNEGETIKSLADKFHISESTIKRMIKKINVAFQKESFSIQTNPISLTGDEGKITQFMSFYFYEKYFFQEEYLTENQISLMVRLIDETLKEVGKESYFPNFKRIFTRVYLNCIRLRNNHDIPINPDRNFRNDILKDEAFCSAFFEAFQLKLTPTTIQKLFHIFSSKDYLFTTKELNHLIQTHSHQKDLYEEIKKVLENISNQFNIPLNQSTEDRLLLDLMNIINIRNINCYHLFMLYNQRERFLSKLSKNYIHVSEMVKNHLMENISLDFTEIEWNELNYILLTHWSDLYDKFRFIEPPINIFLLIDTDMEHGHLIKRELENYSRYNIEVEVMKGHSINQLQLLPEDSVLITNIPGITNVNCAMLCFEEFLGNHEWQELDKLIENIVSHRKS